MSADQTYTNFRTPSRSAAPQTKGHDSVLKAIQNRNQVLHVMKLSGEESSGLIVGRDKYTVTLKDAQGIRRVIFKHAIEEFWTTETVTPANAE
jgi:sRNA-binding regulator protein Hfq